MMNVQPIGADAQLQSQALNPPAAGTGGGASQSQSAAQSATRLQTSSSTIVQSSSASFSQNISSMMSAISPFVADQELLKAIMLLIVLQQLLGENSRGQQSGLLLPSLGGSSSFQSVQFSYSEQSTQYVQQLYQQQISGEAGAAQQGAGVNAGGSGDPSAGLDLQA